MVQVKRISGFEQRSCKAWVARAIESKGSVSNSLTYGYVGLADNISHQYTTYGEWNASFELKGPSDNMANAINEILFRTAPVL